MYFRQLNQVQLQQLVTTAQGQEKKFVDKPKKMVSSKPQIKRVPRSKPQATVFKSVNLKSSGFGQAAQANQQFGEAFNGHHQAILSVQKSYNQDATKFNELYEPATMMQAFQNHGMINYQTIQNETHSNRQNALHLSQPFSPQGPSFQNIFSPLISPKPQTLVLNKGKGGIDQQVTVVPNRNTISPHQMQAEPKFIHFNHNQAASNKLRQSNNQWESDKNQRGQSSQNNRSYQLRQENVQGVRGVSSDQVKIRQPESWQLLFDGQQLSNGYVVSLACGPLRRQRYINAKIENELAEFKEEIFDKFVKSEVNKNFVFPRMAEKQQIYQQNRTVNKQQDDSLRVSKNDKLVLEDDVSDDEVQFGEVVRQKEHQYMDQSQEKQKQLVRAHIKHVAKQGISTERKINILPQSTAKQRQGQGEQLFTLVNQKIINEQITPGEHQLNDQLTNKTTQNSANYDKFKYKADNLATVFNSVVINSSQLQEPETRVQTATGGRSKKLADQVNQNLSKVNGLQEVHHSHTRPPTTANIDPRRKVYQSINMQAENYLHHIETGNAKKQNDNVLAMSQQDPFQNQRNQKTQSSLNANPALQKQKRSIQQNSQVISPYQKPVDHSLFSPLNQSQVVKPMLFKAQQKQTSRQTPTSGIGPMNITADSSANKRNTQQRNRTQLISPSNFGHNEIQFLTQKIHSQMQNQAHNTIQSPVVSSQVNPIGASMSSRQQQQRPNNLPPTYQQRVAFKQEEQEQKLRNAAVNNFAINGEVAQRKAPSQGAVRQSLRIESQPGARQRELISIMSPQEAAQQVRIVNQARAGRTNQLPNQKMFYPSQNNESTRYS